MHAMPIERTIEEAAEVIRSGGIVAYPTEAVWGLGCDPFDEGAVHRLLAIKQRPVEKGLILIAATLEQLKPLIDVAAVPTDRLANVLSSWPGPYTWVMPATAQAPRWITGQHRGIAVRVAVSAEESHDLLATNWPVSHAKDAREFVAFAKAMAGARTPLQAAFGLFVKLPLAVGLATATRMRRNVRAATRHAVTSLAGETYWSRAISSSFSSTARASPGRPASPYASPSWAKYRLFAGASSTARLSSAIPSSQRPSLRYAHPSVARPRA